ncbi:hypothetical protein B0H19DRAFT_104337 [Mycena capillaripes]|nr:hypothetical protein B0H19DRAFT_104337 [Mycena capillaripes]
MTRRTASTATISQPRHGHDTMMRSPSPQRAQLDSHLWGIAHRAYSPGTRRLCSLPPRSKSSAIPRPYTPRSSSTCPPLSIARPHSAPQAGSTLDHPSELLRPPLHGSTPSPLAYPYACERGCAL